MPGQSDVGRPLFATVADYVIMSKDCIDRHNATVSGDIRSGRTIVFVPGLGTEQRIWHAVADVFSGDFKQVFLDHAGATASNRDYFLSHQSKYINVTGYVDDLLEVCDALEERGPAVFIGHSLGAMTCLLASIRRPALFGKLVLIGASPCYLNVGDYRGGMDRGDVDAIYHAVHNDFSNWVTTFATSIAGDPDQPEIASLFKAAISGIPREMLLTVLCSILQQDRRKDMQRVSVPTLIVQTRNDPLVPLAVAEYLQSNIRGSRLALIDTHGHLPHASAPDEVAKAIRGFIL